MLIKWNILHNSSESQLAKSKSIFRIVIAINVFDEFDIWKCHLRIAKHFNFVYCIKLNMCMCITLPFFLSLVENIMVVILMVHAGRTESYYLLSWMFYQRTKIVFWQKIILTLLDTKNNLAFPTMDTKNSNKMNSKRRAIW